ncbi:MAG: acyloxyacyl hydrolase [Aliidongia sp.]
MIKSRILAALAGAMLFGAAAQAQSISIDAPDSARLVLGAGGYDIIGANSHTAGIFRGEYDFDTKLLWILRPMIGGEVTTDGSTYAYGGFGADIYFGNHWVLTPNAAVGFWARGSDDAQNLGSWVEFRTGAEVDYRFDNYSRLGASFHHISNAGLTQRNPGEEEVLVTYSIPLLGAP